MRNRVDGTDEALNATFMVAFRIYK